MGDGQGFDALCQRFRLSGQGFAHFEQNCALCPVYPKGFAQDIRQTVLAPAPFFKTRRNIFQTAVRAEVKAEHRPLSHLAREGVNPATLNTFGGDHDLTRHRFFARAQDQGFERMTKMRAHVV